MVIFQSNAYALQFSKVKLARHVAISKAFLGLLLGLCWASSGPALHQDCNNKNTYLLLLPVLPLLLLRLLLLLLLTAPTYYCYSYCCCCRRNYCYCLLLPLPTTTATIRRPIGVRKGLVERLRRQTWNVGLRQPHGNKANGKNMPMAALLLLQSLISSCTRAHGHTASANTGTRARSCKLSFPYAVFANCRMRTCNVGLRQPRGHKASFPHAHGHTAVANTGTPAHSCKLSFQKFSRVKLVHPVAISRPFPEPLPGFSRASPAPRLQQ